MMTTLFLAWAGLASAAMNNGSADDDDADYFDVVRANNVIEHLSSPRAMVRAVHRIIRPGGLFAFSAPNFDSLSVRLLGRNWPYIRGDHHIHLFGPKTLTRLLEHGIIGLFLTFPLQQLKLKKARSQKDWEEKTAGAKLAMEALALLQEFIGISLNCMH